MNGLVFADAALAQPAVGGVALAALVIAALMAAAFAVAVLVRGGVFAGRVDMENQPCAGCGRRFEAHSWIVRGADGLYYHPACEPRPTGKDDGHGRA